MIEPPRDWVRITDRCPSCLARIPAPRPLGAGATISEAVQHLPGCTYQQHPLIEVHMPPLEPLAPLPAPGPVWSNGLDETDDPTEPGYTAADLEEARATLARAFADHGQLWNVWILAYLAATAAINEPHRIREVLAILAALSEVKPWPSTTN